MINRTREPVPFGVPHAALSVLLAITVLVLLGTGIWTAASFFLLLFASLLLAIFLTACSDPLRHVTGMSHGLALFVIVVLLAVVVAMAVWFLAPQVAEQAEQLYKDVPNAVTWLQNRARHYEWSRSLLNDAQQSTGSMTPPLDYMGNVLSRLTGAFSLTLSVLASLVLFVVIGLYLAAEPMPYRNGVLHLLPLQTRGRARVVLDEIHGALRWWLVGRLFSMTLVGIATTVGLAILGIPLAITLGLIAAALDFVPNIGPFIAGLPAVLIALTQSPALALQVLILYTVIQLLEGYLLTPLIQSRTVSLPPVVTLIAQVLMSIYLGTLGLLLATPITVVAFILVKRLYVEDMLGERT